MISIPIFPHIHPLSTLRLDDELNGLENMQRPAITCHMYCRHCRWRWMNICSLLTFSKVLHNSFLIICDAHTALSDRNNSLWNCLILCSTLCCSVGCCKSQFAQMRVDCAILNAYYEKKGLNVRDSLTFTASENSHHHSHTPHSIIEQCIS